MLVMVLMTLIPTLLIGGAVNYYAVTTVKSEKMAAMANSSHLMSAQLGSYYAHILTDLKARAINDEFIDVLKGENEEEEGEEGIEDEIASGEISPELRQEIERNILSSVAFPVLGGAVIDRDGRIVISTEPKEEGLMLNKTDLYRNILKGEQSYNGLISDSDSTGSAEIAVPIKEDGKLLGILKINIDLEVLGEYMGNLNPEKTYFAFIIRRNGFFIFDKSRPDATILYHEYQNSSSLEKLVSDYKAGKPIAEKGFVAFEDKGDEYIGAYEEVPFINGIAVIAADKKGMLGEFYEMRNDFALIILAVLIVIATVGAVFSSIHAAMLRRVNDTLHAITNGELTARCSPVKGAPEFQILCENINNLADNYQKNERELRMTYRIDGLTHIPNRYTIYEVLDTLLYKSPNQALLLIDIDGLKDLNDNLGNDFGDKVLMQMGDILRKLPQHVCYPSRLGAAEFLIFITNWTAPKYPERIAAKIIKEAENIRFIDEVRVDISLSVGIEYANEERIDKKKLIKYANIAMHKAKTIGKNSYFVHYPNMQKETQK
jgi:diguanylate cyclase (GGDEF)-like protein